ncbi:hypothetical protein FRB91_003689 [Serendipita sp. 411]|nr:hypothetical protein FRC18_003112 [Serendipita sp. 400]KAG8842972.1 hypothetical protein FRB91_003689 [Serendipita sp. 411]
MTCLGAWCQHTVVASEHLPSTLQQKILWSTVISTHISLLSLASWWSEGGRKRYRSMRGGLQVDRKFQIGQEDSRSYRDKEAGDIALLSLERHVGITMNPTSSSVATSKSGHASLLKMTRAIWSSDPGN